MSNMALQLSGIGALVCVGILILLLVVDIVVKIYDNNKILNKLEDKFLGK